MDVAITGSSGLIGTALSRSLETDGHRVVRVTRSPSGPGTVRWNPASGTIDGGALEGLDAVVHLAGEGIASRPWTKAQRRRLVESRRLGTRTLVGALAQLKEPPAVLVSASAIGFYGERGDSVLTEEAAPGDDFLARLCVDWEAEARRAEEVGIRTATVRTGIVLARHGGALAAQLPAYRLGLGAQAGDGRPWCSWIALADEIAAIRHVIDEPSVSGPINLTAPNPVTNAELTDAIGRALGRPTFLRIPRLARRLPLGLGDLIGSLLFTSARVDPQALNQTGFEFRYPDLDQALAAALGRP